MYIISDTTIYIAELDVKRKNVKDANILASPFNETVTSYILSVTESKRERERERERGEGEREFVFLTLIDLLHIFLQWTQ